jgi:hypothetical protein
MSTATRAGVACLLPQPNGLDAAPRAPARDLGRRRGRQAHSGGRLLGPQFEGDLKCDFDINGDGWVTFSGDMLCSDVF